MIATSCRTFWSGIEAQRFPRVKCSLFHGCACPEHFFKEFVERRSGKAEGFLSSGRLPRAGGQFAGEIEFLDLEVEFTLRGGQNKAGRLTVGVNPSPAVEFFRLDRLAQLRKEAESEHAARGVFFRAEVFHVEDER